MTDRREMGSGRTAGAAGPATHSTADSADGRRPVQTHGDTDAAPAAAAAAGTVPPDTGEQQVIDTWLARELARLREENRRLITTAEDDRRRKAKMRAEIARLTTRVQELRDGMGLTGDELRDRGWGAQAARLLDLTEEVELCKGRLEQQAGEAGRRLMELTAERDWLLDSLRSAADTVENPHDVRRWGRQTLALHKAEHGQQQPRSRQELLEREVDAGDTGQRRLPASDELPSGIGPRRGNGPTSPEAQAQPEQTMEGAAERVERIREQLRRQPHLVGECIDDRVELMLEIEQLTADREEGRKAAAHLWFGGEHGVSQDEVCEWYPWVVPLLSMHAREWTERRLNSRRELRDQRDQARAVARRLMIDPTFADRVRALHLPWLHQRLDTDPEVQP